MILTLASCGTPFSCSKLTPKEVFPLCSISEREALLWPLCTQRHAMRTAPTKYLKNQRMAIKLFQQAFDLGSFEAGFHLGHMYMAIGSFAEGLETYTRLSDMGYAPAMYRLGYEYGYGDPSIRNVEKGEESWKRGARHGHFFAAYGIGNLLLRRRTIRGFVEGWIRKLASLRLMPSFVSFRLTYPNSDRLRI